jgi:hypothetical protein
MKPFTLARAFALLSVLAAAAAIAGSAQTGAVSTPANDIVGLWSTYGSVGPCGDGPPIIEVRNTLLFHAGGTVVENPRFGPQGAPNVAGIPGIYQRGQALGTWSYDPSERRYSMHLLFDNFVDNAYHGYSTVDRDFVLSDDGSFSSGPVTSSRYLADGSLMFVVCGLGASTRI